MLRKKCFLQFFKTDFEISTLIIDISVDELENRGLCDKCCQNGLNIISS